MSTSRYIQKVRSLVQAKCTKVQYKNHSVGTDIIFNGIIPCNSISKKQITYIENPKCPCIIPVPKPVCNHNISNYTILNGGTSTSISSTILNGGNSSKEFICILNGNIVCENIIPNNKIILNGGIPKTRSSIILNGGTSKSTSFITFNGGTPITTSSIFLNGGTSTSISSIIFDGGKSITNSICFLNSIV